MIEYIPRKKNFANACEKYSLLDKKIENPRDPFLCKKYVLEALKEQDLNDLAFNFERDCYIACDWRRDSPNNNGSLFIICQRYLDYANKVANEKRGFLTK